MKKTENIIYKQEEEKIEVAKFEREVEYLIKKEMKIKNIKEK